MVDQGITAPSTIPELGCDVVAERGNCSFCVGKSVAKNADVRCAQLSGAATMPLENANEECQERTRSRTGGGGKGG